MPIMEAVTGFKVATAEYDFAIDGGAVGSITLRSVSVDSVGALIPVGSVILGGFVDVRTACLSGTGTIALTVESAGDVLAATGQAGLTAGVKSVVPAFTGASAVKTTAARSIVATIATAAYTAGRLHVALAYI